MGSAPSTPSDSSVNNTTKRRKDDDNADIMSDEELQQFRRNTFNDLRKTANDVVALDIRQEQYEENVTELYGAIVKFFRSYFALKRTVRANIEQFRKDVAKLMMDTKYFKLSCDFFIYGYKSRWHLGDQRLPKVALVVYMQTLQCFGDASDDMAIAQADEPGYIETLKQMIEDFRPKHFATEEDMKLSRIEEEILGSALGSIHNLTMRETNMSKLRDAGMIECLKPYLKSSNNDYALLAFTCLAGMINEEECDIIYSNKQLVEYLLDSMKKGLKQKMRIWKSWPSKECAFSIKLLARNDANVKILLDLGALELLVQLGRIGDEDEQCESVSALWALCFVEESKTLITGKQELGVVDLLADLKSSKNEKIKKACNGALWNLRDALKKSNVNKYKKIGEQFGADRELKDKKGDKSKQVISEDKVSSKGHVMISYQWADQQILKNVRDNIKTRGFKVWMDIDQMGGSTLQAMADAVEGADVILVCMSNKYKHSPSCRAEAEYAFQLRKHIIPLKMERGYTPDGWLGFIVGAKLFFEFSPKYPFEDKMKGLLKEIDGIFGGRKEDIPDSGQIITPTVALVNEVASANLVGQAETASSVTNSFARMYVSKTTVENLSKWNADDVKKWIEGNGLQKCGGICNLSGGEIALLASMRVECPEFFYKCLQDMLNIKDLLTMSKVFLALHRLS